MGEEICFDLLPSSKLYLISKKLGKHVLNKRLDITIRKIARDRT